MKKINLSFVLFGILLLTTACTNQMVYDSVEDNFQDAECQYLPISAYDECITRRSQLYDDYQESRQEVLNKDD